MLWRISGKFGEKMEDKFFFFSFPVMPNEISFHHRIVLKTDSCSPNPFFYIFMSSACPALDEVEKRSRLEPAEVETQNIQKEWLKFGGNFFLTSAG